MNLIDGADLSVTGRFGSGIAFGNDAAAQAARGVTASAAAHAATQIAGDFSVLVWVRLTAADLTNDFNRFIDTSSNTGSITTGYRLMTSSAANIDNFRFLGVGTSNTDVIHSRNLVANTWIMLATRYDADGNATVNVLFDGDTVDAPFVGANSQSVAATGPIVYNPDENTNFASMDTPTLDVNEFEGSMDDAAFFSGLLTDAEIATAFNRGSSALIPEPASAALLALASAILLRRRMREPRSGEGNRK
ncbi:MAG: LamG-like jellyroll fold domain-containing protein [Verrucomicrobiales bacterium]